MPLRIDNIAPEFRQRELKLIGALPQPR